MSRPTPPCYDREKKEGCPFRSSECHATCPLWKAYEEEREAGYAVRRENIRRKQVVCDYIKRKDEQAKKRWKNYKSFQTEREK